MIDKQALALELQSGLSRDIVTRSSSSAALPTLASLPPFEDEPSETHHLLVDFTDGSSSAGEPLYDEPPPDFAPYQADYFEVGYGDIVSHDPHLNTDGEALYRFLLSQAERTTPFYQLNCRGTHTEHRSRWVTERTHGGRTESRTESYTETITDFDFCINIRPWHFPSAQSSSRPPSDPFPAQTSAPVVHWSVADTEPAYRGLMVREVELRTGKWVAMEAENRLHKKWVEKRTAHGLPPWVGPESMDSWTEGQPGTSAAGALRSSKTLRQWADQYCESKKYLKEFVYHKILYGWDLLRLEAAVRESIGATMYTGHVDVQFKVYGSKVYIRPDNRLSRMLSNKWLKFLSILLLVFPFIWLFKRFHPRGGGSWQVCGGAYAMKQWVPVDAADEEFGAVQSDVLGKPGSGTTQLPTSRMKPVGVREGEWFRRWEKTITRAVLQHYVSSTPIVDAGPPDLSYLDGY